MVVLKSCYCVTYYGFNGLDLVILHVHSEENGAKSFGANWTVCFVNVIIFIGIYFHICELMMYVSTYTH